MDAILPYLINTLVGAGGGWLGNMLNKNGLGMVGNLIAGAAGGNILPLILNQFMNSGGAEGGFDWMSIVASLIGGTGGSLLGGLIKKA